MGLGRGQAEWGSPLPQRGAWAAPQAASSLFGRMRASGALQGGGADVFVLRAVCKGAWWVLLLTSLFCALPSCAGYSYQRTVTLTRARNTPHKLRPGSRILVSLSLSMPVRVQKSHFTTHVAQHRSSGWCTAEPQNSEPSARGSGRRTERQLTRETWLATNPQGSKLRCGSAQYKPLFP